METQSQTQSPKAAFIVIGNEILSGRTQDVNVYFLANGLTKIGIRLVEVRIVPDIKEEIIHALNDVREKYDYVFTSGGIGPTHDDITTDSIASAFNKKVILNKAAEKMLQDYYVTSKLTPARLKMAQLPENCKLIYNPITAAPGFIMENVYALAGVPSIFQAMFHEIKDSLHKGALIISKSIKTSLSEGIIAEDLEDLQIKYPLVEIGSYPFLQAGSKGTELVLRSTDNHLLMQAYKELEVIIDNLKNENL